MKPTLSSMVTLVMTTVLLGGCQQEVHQQEPHAIKAPTPERTLVATSRILREGEPAGWMRTWRVEDGSAREYTEVYNLRYDHLGFITDDGRAYRLTAHDGHDLVANHRERTQNVAAIMGDPLRPVKIEQIASIQQ